MNQQTEEQLPPMPEGYMKSGTYTVEYFDAEGERTGVEYGLSERTANLIVAALEDQGLQDVGGHTVEVEITYHLNGSDFYAEADWRWTHGA